MKKKRIIFVAIAFLLVPVILFTVLFGVSFTDDSYACYSCRSLGRSKAVRVFRVPVWKKHKRVTLSLTRKQCDHEWQWYFANSKGFLYNREDWDGPIGNYPFAEEIDAARAEGKQVEVKHQ